MRHPEELAEDAREREARERAEDEALERAEASEHEAVKGLRAQLGEERAAWERLFVWAAAERAAREGRAVRPELFQRSLVRPPGVTGRLRSEREDEERRDQEREERLERERNRDERERLRLWKNDGIETDSDYELRRQDEADLYGEDDDAGRSE